jgi:hypothetical protein
MGRHHDGELALRATVLGAILMATTPAWAYWTETPIDEMAQASDAIFVVEVVAVGDGTPPPPPDDASACVPVTGQDAADVGRGVTAGYECRSRPPTELYYRQAEAARNLLRARVTDVVRGEVRIGDTVSIDVPWSMSRDVLPMHGPSFTVGETALLFVRRGTSARTFRLTVDGDGKHVVDGDRYRNAMLAPPYDWRSLSELKRSARSPSTLSPRHCGGCGTGESSAGAALVMAFLGWGPRRALRTRGPAT